MMYLSSREGHLRIIILETENLEEIRKGHCARTPDGAILIAWTPDPEWLAERILASKGDSGLIAAAIDEAAKRPQQPLRPSHDPRHYNL